MTKYCPRCGKKLLKEKDPELKKTYPWVCSKDDENFFDFEANDKPVKTL